MEFVLLKHRKGDYEYRMLIDNEADLLRFQQHDIDLNSRAFVDVSTRVGMGHPDGRRNRTMESLMHVIEVSADGKTSMAEGLSRAFNLKYAGMRKILEIGRTLCITSGGSYCDLEGYVDIHGCTILKRMKKDSFGFPTDVAPSNKKYVVLENHTGMSIAVYNYFQQLQVQKEDYCVLADLTSLDVQYVIEHLMLAETIVIDSTFEKKEQVEAFLTLFYSMPKKNIILFSYQFTNIVNHPLYIKNLEKHNVTTYQI